jgi:hypothetical protein
MAECFNCGTVIPKGEAYRREVYTGHYNRVYFGRRLSGSAGNRYAIRSLCADCAHKLDNRKANHLLIGLGVVFFS